MAEARKIETTKSKAANRQVSFNSQILISTIKNLNTNLHNCQKKKKSTKKINTCTTSI